VKTVAKEHRLTRLTVSAFLSPGPEVSLRRLPARCFASASRYQSSLRPPPRSCEPDHADRNRDGMLPLLAAPSNQLSLACVDAAIAPAMVARLARDHRGVG
jgi:hypothetical protein